ncbi:peptidoglycan/LPS O-acetylase OafA/YrhL [Paraburkholderia sp. BL8N3]|nr:acyltransferase [Paraburkholderia sp. BL8N3]TCK42745.1 peptidoglycan/LPS O-acetylase OafA/YrhL [Paraburkholderia sp. BL8N3]
MKYRLQYLRAAAAFLVVVWHASYHVWEIRGDNFMLSHTPGLSGAFGVTLFFVISGYLMATLAGKNTAGQFMLHRVIRIYPIYWLVVVLFFVGNTALGYGFTFDPYAFALLPGPGRVYPLGVEWTLPFELSFYLVVFLIILLRAARALPVIGALWAAAIVVLLLAAPDLQQGQFPRLSHLLVSQWTLPFTLGLLVPTAIRRGIVSSYSWIAGLVLIFLAWQYQAYAIYLLPLGCVGLVHWAVVPRAAEPGHDTEIRLLTRLGDWSYALYLCHVPIMLWMYRLAPGSWSGVALWCISVVLSLVVAAGLGTVDLWLYRRLKSRIDSLKLRTTARLGPAFACVLLLYSGYAEHQSYRDGQLAASVDELGRRLEQSHPSTTQAIEVAAQQAHFALDASLVGSADSITCGEDGTLQVRGWVADKVKGTSGIAIMMFQGGDYRGSILPRFPRPDVVQILNLQRFNQTPGFSAEFGKHTCTSGCSEPMFLAVKGNGYASLPIDPHVPACLKG